MSATLPNRDGRLPAFLLAALFALALGSPEAWPAVRSGGGGAVHAGVPRSGFVAGRFAGRRFGDRFARGRHRGRGFFPFGYGGDPYWYGYDQDYEYEPGAYPRGYWHSGYCDVSPRSYPQDCVWKDGP